MSWYYCLAHKAVEPEAGCANAERMGPYATEAEASAALEKAHDRNEAFEFILGNGQVIRGWEEGVAEMSKGQVVKLRCTPDYAYGEQGFPPSIPGNATLIFEIELIDFK
mgnify:CR=1 FL=1